MPSRLFWFFVGGAAVTWWTNHKSQHPPCSRRVGNDLHASTNATWDSDKARITDRVTELSEVTLDNILSTITTFKGKLAEHRLQRERERTVPAFASEAASDQVPFKAD